MPDRFADDIGRRSIMNIQKFTQKSVEAVNLCEKLAMEYGNQELEPNR